MKVVKAVFIAGRDPPYDKIFINIFYNLNITT